MNGHATETIKEHEDQLKKSNVNLRKIENKIIFS